MAAPIRVLVADDKAQLRLLVRMLVEHMGLEVVDEAVNGLDLVAKAAELRPDIVVTDWDMPRMKGLEATALIKADRPECQVIAYTSTVDPALERLFLRSGASAFVSKSDVPALIAAVERCRDAVGGD